MKRKDWMILALLIAFAAALPAIDRKLFVPLFGTPKPRTPPTPAVTNAPPAAAAAPDQPAKLEPTGTNTVAAALPAAEAPSAAPVQTWVLENADVRLTFGSRGGALRRADMLQYPSSHKNAAPVELGFEDQPTLALTGIPGAGTEYDFTAVETCANRLVLERTTAAGLKIRREFQLDGYTLNLRETLINTGAAPCELERPGWRLGALYNLPDEAPSGGYPTLGVDTFVASERATHWSAKLPRFFEDKRKAAGALPPSIEEDVLPERKGAEWVAVKNKYFTQILLLGPDRRAAAVRATATRTIYPQEIQPGFRPRLGIATVGAVVEAGRLSLAPGAPAVKLEADCYIGPKKLALIERLPFQPVDVMEFGFWGGIARLLLRVLVFFHSVIPNYGVAIILLTLLVRSVFWPITHASNVSMRRMAEVAPLIKELQAKYKDNPQRVQRETMALYKEHKINPLGGCLPLLIQIPVFISLFVMLRAAIELRLSGFLWVRDLSAPENLFLGTIGFGVNLLPLIMTVTSVWQQKLTPTAGDPAQQRMMSWMPWIMLMFFYSFASGLVLYWTTNQVLMIAQMLWSRRRIRHAAAASGGWTKPGA